MVQFGGFYALTQETDLGIYKYLKWNGRCIYLFMIPDIVRFILIIVVCIELKSHHVLFALLPHCIFIFTAGLTDIYFFSRYCINQTKLKWNNSDDYCKMFCRLLLFWLSAIILLFPLNFILVSILWFIFPYTTFHWRVVFVYPHYAQRFFVATNDCNIKPFKQYIQTLLKYNINHNNNKKEIFKRIVATNYYLMSVFKEEIEQSDERAEWEAIFVDETMYQHSNPQKVITNIATIHNQYLCHMNNTVSDEHKLIKMDRLNWADIGLNFEKLHVDCMISLSLFLKYIVFNTLMVITIYVYCHITDQLHEAYVFVLFVLYIVIEALYIPLNIKFYSLASYSCFILPGIINIKSLKWEEKLEIQSMIEDIQTIYDILYRTTNEIEAVYQCIVQHDIAYIVAQYLWYKLPSNVSEMDHVISQYNFLEIETEHDDGTLLRETEEISLNELVKPIRNKYIKLNHI